MMFVPVQKCGEYVLVTWLDSHVIKQNGKVYDEKGVSNVI